MTKAQGSGVACAKGLPSRFLAERRTALLTDGARAYSLSGAVSSGVVLDGMRQPVPQFFPAWDVRESWQPWIGWAVAGLIFWLLAAAVWHQRRRVWRPDAVIGREPGPGRGPAAWKVASSLGVVFLLGVFVTTCSNGIYALRAPLMRGDAAYSVGQVANTRYEGVPGSTRNIWRLFDVSGQTFRMPFLNPHLCVPRDGEWVRLWSSPQTVPAPRGTTTRQVLRMEMTRPCHIRPWG